MQITLDYLISYVRGLDERLTDEVKYTDSVLTDKIRYGIHNLAALVQPFAKEEFIDLNPYLAQNIQQFQLTMQEQVLGYYGKTIVILNGSVYEDISITDILVQEQLDKSLYITVPNIPAQPVYLRVKYFYALDIEKTPILEVEPEIWHFMKHSIQIVVWGSLKDYEKEQYHTKVLDSHVSQKILQPPVQPASYSMKGGFI